MRAFIVAWCLLAPVGLSTSASAICVSKASGSYASPAVWNDCGGTVPGPGDTVDILVGHSLTLLTSEPESALRVTVSGSLVIGPLASLQVFDGGIEIREGGTLELDSGILILSPPLGSSAGLEVKSGAHLDVHGQLVRAGALSWADEISTVGRIALKDDAFDITSSSYLEDPRPGTALVLRVEDGDALGRIFDILPASIDPLTDIFEVNPESHDSQPVALNARLTTTATGVSPRDLVLPDTTVRKAHEGIGRWAIFHETGNRYLIADAVDGNSGPIVCSGTGIESSFVRDVTTTALSETATLRIRFSSLTDFTVGTNPPDYDSYGAGIVGVRFVHPKIEFDLRRFSAGANPDYCDVEVWAEGTPGVRDIIRLLTPRAPADVHEAEGPPGTNDFTLGYGLKSGDRYEITDPAEIYSEGATANFICRDGSDCRLERAVVRRTGALNSHGIVVFGINNDSPSPPGEHFHLRRVELTEFEGGYGVLATAENGQDGRIEISDCTIHSTLTRLPDTGHGIKLLGHRGSTVQRTLFYDLHDDCLYTANGGGDNRENVYQDNVCMDMDYGANGGQCFESRGYGQIVRRNRCFGGSSDGLKLAEGSLAYRNIIIGALQNETGPSRGVLAIGTLVPDAARVYGNLIAFNGAASYGVDLFHNLVVSNETGFERSGSRIVGNIFSNNGRNDTGKTSVQEGAVNIISNLFAEETSLTIPKLLARSTSGPIRVSHNTFAIQGGSLGSFVSILDTGGAKPAVDIRDNIFESGSAGYVMNYSTWDGDAERIETDYNLYETTSLFANTPIPFPQGADDLPGEAQFEDAAGMDFRLTDSSPAQGSASDGSNRGMGRAGFLCDCLPISLTALGLTDLAFQRAGAIHNDVDGDGVTDVGDVLIRGEGVRFYLPGVVDPQAFDGFQIEATDGVEQLIGPVPVTIAAGDAYELSEETIGAYAALLGNPALMTITLSTIDPSALSSAPLLVPLSNDIPRQILDYGCNADTSAEPDADLDGLVDGCDPAPGNPDADGDGLPDGEEDANRNGLLDPGESDPTNPFDPPSNLPALGAFGWGFLVFIIAIGVRHDLLTC